MTAIVLIGRPILGAVIGYITNDIAIRMLFRPRTAKYLFGVKLPFTPGLIPKEKSRIASNIGAAISQNLMNREVLEKTLLAPEMQDKISHGIHEFVETQKRNDETLEQFLLHYLKRDDLAEMKESVTGDLSKQIHTALSSARLGTKIAKIVIAHAIDKVRSGVSNVGGLFGGGLAGGLGGLFGGGRRLIDQFVDLITAPAEDLLSKNINDMLANHSHEMVGTMIDDQITKFLSLPMKDLFAGRDAQIEKAEKTILSLYRTLITEQLPRILDTINISKIVEDRINEMDVKETERLILEVMKKELSAIVWLGALLGFIMGCINLLF